jgi:hypothetical protein
MDTKPSEIHSLPPKLCYRCEERARYFEQGHAARCECMGPGAVHGCYMYRPVVPLVLVPLDGERRPIAAGWGISGRAKAVRIATPDELELRVAPGPNKLEVIFYYTPAKALRKIIRGLKRALKAKLKWKKACKAEGVKP